MEKSKTNHYFVIYEGYRCEHFIARPEDVELLNYYDDNQPESKKDYSNTYESPIMAVRVYTGTGRYIVFPNVTKFGYINYIYQCNGSAD